MHPVISRLMQSPEPSIRYKTCILTGEDPNSPSLQALRQEISTSPRVLQLLSERDNQGGIPCHPYRKWYGTHWVLVSLAELDYPPGDPHLIPLREQELQWLLSPEHFKHILEIQGRIRRCASQESNALFSLLSLGLADDRVDELARRLIQWQWADGGWNCDKRPDAINSSFMETITPLRALTLYAKITGNPHARAAVDRAAEIFLKRQLFKRQSDGRVIDPKFLRLHVPLYWHYDILFCLKILADAGFLADPRCQDALALLASTQLQDGGFPAQEKYYNPAGSQAIIPLEQRVSGYSLVDWGPTGSTRMNEFVTVDALSVLSLAGMIQNLF